MSHLFRSAVVIALFGLLAACGSKDLPKTAPADVWANVNGHEIRRDDVEKAFRSAVEPAASPSEVETLAAKLGIVDELITQELLLTRAKTLNLEVTEAEVDTAFAERKRNMTEDTFLAQIKQRNLTADDMRTLVRRELVVQKVIEKEVSSKISVPDQEISDYYTKNKAQFNIPETQYHIAQIVITPMKDPQIMNRTNDDATSPAEADKKVMMLAERLKAGSRFSEIAMDYSEDPRSAPQGGDLGFVSATALQKVPPLLRDAVLKAEPGTFRVVSSGGAHTLVMLVERAQAGQRALTDPNVRDSIRDSLRDRKEQVLRTAYLTAARNDAKIVNYLARQVVDAQGKLPALAPVAPPK